MPKDGGITITRPGDNGKVAVYNSCGESAVAQSSTLKPQPGVFEQRAKNTHQMGVLRQPSFATILETQCGK